jgi:hypothetical protein
MKSCPLPRKDLISRGFAGPKQRTVVVRRIERSPRCRKIALVLVRRLGWVCWWSSYPWQVPSPSALHLANSEEGQAYESRGDSR